MVFRKGTFIGIKNGEGDMEASRGDFSTKFIDAGIAGFGNAAIAAGQSCDGGFDNVLTDSAMKIGSGPLHLNIYDTI